MELNRKEFILAALAAGLVPTGFGESAGSNRKIRLAAQMYSLRGIVKDPHGFFAMLRLMKDFGYAGAEFAGVWGNPKDVKKFMSDIGLACAGAHTGLGQCLASTMAKTCEYNLSYGNDKIVMPWAQPPKDCADEKGWWKKLGADLSAGAEVAKTCGCHLAYHNHGHEFTKKVDGVLVWDLIMSDASPDLEVQFDVGHLANAGEDAAEWFARYPKSVRTIHAKNVCLPAPELKPAAGKRGIDWPQMFELTKSNITEWYIVEAEANPADTMKMKHGADFLRKAAPFLG